MSISLRTHRALIYQYADVGTEGAVDSVYVPFLSADADGAWWCSEGFDGLRETTVAGSAQHNIDGVFLFHAEVTISPDDALIVNGKTYIVRALRPCRYGRNEQLVMAEHVVHMTLTLTS